MQLNKEDYKENPQKEDRRPWREEVNLIINFFKEDTLIDQLVKVHGMKKWALIADVLKQKVNRSNRNGKQCRERYYNN